MNADEIIHDIRLMLNRLVLVSSSKGYQLDRTPPIPTEDRITDADVDHIESAIIEKLNELRACADELAAYLDTQPVERQLLRTVWERGIQTAIGYGDNVHHLQGAQADRIFDKLMVELAALPASSAPPPSSADDVRHLVSLIRAEAASIDGSEDARGCGDRGRLA